MAESSDTYHEPLDQITAETRHMHQALVSLQEELEAIDWYRQRADACQDEELREVLLHNMREEVEHACMVLEWLRRRNEDFARNMETYLFKQKPIVELEEVQELEEAAAASGHVGPSAREDLTRHFTIGDLKRKRS